jgi:hypothetical protein
MMSQAAPTAPLSLDAWQQELKQLAARAEQLGPDASLQARLAVASDWFRLLWLSCDPAWIARSCRLASRLCEPLMAMPAGVDEQVVSSWEARKAALKSVGALKELGPGPVADPSLIGKMMGRKPQPKPAPAPAFEPARVKVQQVAVTPRQLRPRSERIAARPAPAPDPPAEPDQAPVPAGWEVEPAAAPVAAAEPDQAPMQPGWGGEPVPAPVPARRRLVAAGGVPDGWISVEGLADRLHLTRGAVQRWAREGLIPECQMLQWRGRWWFDPAVEPPPPQPRQIRPAPDGWMHGAEVCSLLGIDRSQLARWRREGVIPAAACQPHGRGYVFDIDVVEALRLRLQPGDGGGSDWTE